MQKWDALERLGDIAVFQYGMVTRAQAKDAGLTDQQLHRLAGRGIEQVEHGVWRMAIWPDDPHQQLRALWLSVDPATSPEDRLRSPKVFASHESAARLYNAGHLVVRKHTLTSPRERRTSRNCNVVVRDVGDEWQIINGIAVTSPARTVADLTEAGASGIHLGDVAADLIDRGHVRADVLAAGLDGYAARFGALTGRAALSDMLEDAERSPGPDLSGWDRESIERELSRRGLALAA